MCIRDRKYLSPSYLSKVAKRFAEQENIEITPFTALELKPFYGANRYYLFIETILLVISSLSLVLVNDNLLISAFAYNASCNCSTGNCWLTNLRE